MPIQDPSFDDVTLAKVLLEPLRNKPVTTHHSHRPRFVGSSIDAIYHRLASVAKLNYDRIAVIAEVAARVNARVDKTLVIVGISQNDLKRGSSDWRRTVRLGHDR